MFGYLKAPLILLKKDVFLFCRGRKMILPPCANRTGTDMLSGKKGRHASDIKTPAQAAAGTSSCPKNRMQRAVQAARSCMGYLLFFLIIMLPLGKILSGCRGYTFVLSDCSAFAVISAVVSAGEAALCAPGGLPKRRENGFITFLLVLTAPLSLINTAFYLSECRSITTAVCMSVCVSCCFFITARCKKTMLLTAAFAILSVLSAAITGVLVLIIIVFGNIRQDTVIYTLISPDGGYCAEVVASDHGALGGNTLVRVHDNENSINALVFRISKNPVTIYSGDFGEFTDIEIYWKSENRIVINGTEHATE